MGVGRITRAEIHRWEYDEGIKLDPWERKLIRDLDDLYIEMMTPKDESKAKGPGTHYVA